MTKWDKQRFSVYDSQEKQVLGLVKELGEYTNKALDNLENKTDLTGDHKGSWQGLSKPTLSEEGMRATVEDINENKLPIINNEVEKIKNKIANEIEINLLDYGCKFDGSTDDTENIQRAINEGNVIVFPYNMTTIITKPLKGKSNLKLKGNNSTIKWRDNCLGVQDTGILDFQGKIYNDVTIENLIIDGNKKLNAWVQNHTYTQTSSNGMDCIRIGDCSNLIIDNVTILDSQKMGILVNGVGNDIKIKNCTINKSARDGIFVVGNNVLVSGCTVIDSRDNSIAFDSDFVPSGSEVGNVIIENCYLINNEKVSNECGIYIGQGVDIVRSNFEVKGITMVGQTFHGIIVQNMNDIKIHDITIKESVNKGGLTSHGMTISGCNIVNVYNCTVIDSQGSALQLKNNKNIKIYDNTLKYNVLTGIWIDGKNEYIECINNTLISNGSDNSNNDSCNIKIHDIEGIGYPYNLIIQKNKMMNDDKNKSKYGILVKTTHPTIIYKISDNEYFNLYPMGGTPNIEDRNLSNTPSYNISFKNSKYYNLNLYDNVQNITISDCCVGEKYYLRIKCDGSNRNITSWVNLHFNSIPPQLQANKTSLFEIIYDSEKYVCISSIINY